MFPRILLKGGIEMSMQDLELSMRYIEEDGSGDFEGPKTDALVQLAEQRLGVKFPPTYKEFLLRLGCGDIAGVEFYGIIDENFDDSAIPNGIWLTLHRREKFGLDPAVLLVGQSGEGYYAIDTSQTDDFGECPVVDWIPIPKEQLEIIAPDFGKFFLDRIQEALDDDDV